MNLLCELYITILFTVIMNHFQVFFWELFLRTIWANIWGQICQPTPQSR